MFRMAKVYRPSASVEAQVEVFCTEQRTFPTSAKSHVPVPTTTIISHPGRFRSA
jgi:hypothetical protein